MQIVKFYRGEIANNNSDTFEDILSWKNHKLECDHDWIQYIFATDEPSHFNSEAPVLTSEEIEIFQSDPLLQEKAKKAFIRFLDFLDMELVEGIVKAKKEVPEWMKVTVVKVDGT